MVGPGLYDSAHFRTNSKYGNHSVMGKFNRSGMSEERLSLTRLGAKVGTSPDPARYQKKVLDFQTSTTNVKFDKTPKNKK